jgi:hypothetical protein
MAGSVSGPGSLVICRGVPPANEAGGAGRGQRPAVNAAITATAATPATQAARAGSAIAGREEGT